MGRRSEVGFREHGAGRDFNLFIAKWVRESIFDCWWGGVKATGEVKNVGGGKEIRKKGLGMCGGT